MGRLKKSTKKQIKDASCFIGALIMFAEGHLDEWKQFSQYNRNLPSSFDVGRSKMDLWFPGVPEHLLPEILDEAKAAVLRRLTEMHVKAKWPDPSMEEILERAFGVAPSPVPRLRIVYSNSSDEED